MDDLERCNCMIRYNGGTQMPAIRREKKFFTPSMLPILPPTTFEDMDSKTIQRVMAERGEVYIGHIYGAISGNED